MSKAEEFARYAEKTYGKGWKSDLGLKNRYNSLLEQDKGEQIIRETTRTIEESFKGKRKDLAFAKLIKGLEELALESLRDRSMKQELFEKQNVLFEEKMKIVASLKRHFKQVIESFEQTKGVLIRQLEGEIKKTKRLQTKAEKIVEEHNQKIAILNDDILRYNERTSELNRKYMEFNKKSKAFNRKVADFNKRRGFRGA